MQIYVGAKWEEKPRVRALYARLRAAGHVITHDWTQENDEGLLGNARLRYHLTCAGQDIHAVIRAELVVILPHPQGKGMYAELGAALALQRPILIVGDSETAGEWCIFLRHWLCQWVPDEDALLEALKKPIEDYYLWQSVHE
jgi:hypothetical protein